MYPDLTKPVSYRGVPLNDVVLTDDVLIGNQITRIQMGGVGATGYIEKKASGDGMNASDVWMQGREVRVNGITYAATRGDLSDRLQTVIAACTPRAAYVESPGDKGFLPLQFFVPTARTGDMIIDSTEVAQWPTGVIECFVRARPTAQPQVIIDRDSTGGDGALAIPWSADFVCIDPRIYVLPRIDVDLSGGAGTQDNTIYNRGSYPAPLNYTFVIAAASGTATVSIVGAGSDTILTIPNHATLARTVRVSTVDEIVTSQLGSEEQTLAISYLANMTNRVWPYIEPAAHADIRVVSNKALAAGSGIWYYEAFA